MDGNVKFDEDGLPLTVWERISDGLWSGAKPGFKVGALVVGRDSLLRSFILEVLDNDEYLVKYDRLPLPNMKIQGRRLIAFNEAVGRLSQVDG